VIPRSANEGAVRILNAKYAISSFAGPASQLTKTTCTFSFFNKRALMCVQSVIVKFLLLLYIFSMFTVTVHMDAMAFSMIKSLFFFIFK
jgi:hypothetical protein